MDLSIWNITNSYIIGLFTLYRIKNLERIRNKRRMDSLKWIQLSTVFLVYDFFAKDLLTMVGYTNEYNGSEYLHTTS